MKRLFSSRQRRVLAFIAGGNCMICGQTLRNGFHADHRIAFSKGGKTVLSNGQALCQMCNLQKGAK